MQWNAEILGATFSQFSWMHIKSQDGSINSESSTVPLLTKDPPRPLLPDTPSLVFITSLVFPILEFRIMEPQSIYFVCPASSSQHYLWNSSILLHVSVVHLFWQAEEYFISLSILLLRTLGYFWILCIKPLWKFSKYFCEYSFFPHFLNTHLEVELLGHRINEYFSHILYEKHYVKVTEHYE